MSNQDAINTPSLAGWAIAFGMAVVAFGVCYLLIDLGGMGSALIALLILLVVGFILGMPKSQDVAPKASADTATTTPAPEPTVAAAATPAAEQTAATATPAPKETAAQAEAPAKAATAAPVTDAMRPQGLEAARDGVADDLKLIKGVGPALEKLCNRLGYYHFDQIAAWTPAEVAWVDSNLEGFKNRVSRDDWVAQAKILAAGGETEFSKRQ